MNEKHNFEKVLVSKLEAQVLGALAAAIAAKDIADDTPFDELTIEANELSFSTLDK